MLNGNAVQRYYRKQERYTDGSYSRSEVVVPKVLHLHKGRLCKVGSRRAIAKIYAEDLISTDWEIVLQ